MRHFLPLLPLALLMYGCGGGGASDSSGPDVPAVSASCSVPAQLAPAEHRPLLVVRVNYSDITFRSSAANWSQKIFGSAEHELNHYYEAISGGRFGFAMAQEDDGDADGVVTVTLNKAHPNYDINDISDVANVFQPDLQAALVKTDAAVDYALYDTDGNGAITPDELLIIFILAGKEYSFYDDPYSAGVWAHQSCIYSPTNTPSLDGVSVMGCAKAGNYAVFGERHIQENIGYDEDATIGIIAHELGHAAFDLPDLYDTSNASAGIGYFGLMASGMWGMKDAQDSYGNTPVPMMAWSRIHNGWIHPETVEQTDTAGIALNDTASETYNIAMLLVGNGQCFLLENRSGDGYDAGLNIIYGYYRGGLALWHIDQAVIDNGSVMNVVNADASHKGVDLEEAAEAGLDDDYAFPGHARNLFWLGNSTRFAADTTPSSRRYDGSDSGVSVTDISAPGPVMTCSVTNPNAEEAQ